MTFCGVGVRNSRFPERILARENSCQVQPISLGVDTALDVALEAIDRIKVTASSHEQAFLAE